MAALTEPETLTRNQAAGLAERMFAGGWTVVEIRDYLAERGQDRTYETVRAWADPEWRLHRRRQQREQARRRRRIEGVRSRLLLDRETKFQFVCKLRAEGLSYDDIAAAFRAFTGDPISRQQVAYALETGSYPDFEQRAEALRSVS